MNTQQTHSYSKSELVPIQNTVPVNSDEISITQEQEYEISPLQLNPDNTYLVTIFLTLYPITTDNKTYRLKTQQTFLFDNKYDNENTIGKIYLLLTKSVEDFNNFLSKNSNPLLKSKTYPRPDEKIAIGKISSLFKEDSTLKI